MFESLRKAMYFGMGAAAMSVDRMRQAINDLVDRGEITTEEGKKLFEEMSSKAEEQGKDMNDKIKSQVRQVLADMGIADRSQITALERRIDALELRVSELSGRTVAGDETASSATCPEPPPVI